ncbi:MAG: class I SAM-dependent methyltransferase [Pseudomonadota bacterium]|nr:class I SAM-dependent methyltransferase [Pseudomonadota bacterium]
MAANPIAAGPAAAFSGAAARPFDANAVAATLRRLARQPHAPWLHGEVARRMAERLEVIRLKPELILDWWGFLGSGADVLEAAYPKARRIVVEPDDGWLARSRAAAATPWWSAGKWRRGSVEVVGEQAELRGGAQLIWANMMLHAVADPPALMARWERLLAVDGFVMFSCLGPGSLRELQALYKRLGWLAPAGSFIDMHDLGDMLVHAGFADPVMDQETLTLRWDSPLALLAELRLLGGNTAPDRMAGLRTPRWRERLLRELDSLRGSDGRIGLGFEVAYGHAFKAAPRLRADTPTTVSLDDMRAMVRAPRLRSGRA